MKKILLLILLASVSVAKAQDANQYDAEVVNHYMGFTLKLTKEGTGFTPPVASRAWGFTGLALYEAIVPGIPSKQSTVGAILGLDAITASDANVNYHWPTVANNALAAIVDSLWANATQLNKDSLHDIRDYYNTLFEGQLDPQDFADSKSFGEAVANDIFQFSKTDGGHMSYASNFPPSYVPPVAPGLWTPLAGQTALQPYWGSHRPFVTDDTVSVIPGPPPAFSTDVNSLFYVYAYQVYQQVNDNTPEQVTIAQYWADGGATITPPGHSISMLRNIFRTEDTNLEAATIGYAKLGVALSDAFLACWKAKYIYNCERPITFIRANIDANWSSLIGTPPFPEYSSGHSSQSGAMSEVMESLFGTSYAFVDSSNGSNFGGPRSFNNFDEAAEEAAVSRLYGGIHYEFGNQTGLLMGRMVGANVVALFDGLVSGQPEQESATVEPYPNPSNGVVTFKSKSFMVTGIEVFDMMGHRVAVSSSQQSSIDLSDLSPGIYMAHAYGSKNGAKATARLVKL